MVCGVVSRRTAARRARASGRPGPPRSPAPRRRPGRPRRRAPRGLRRPGAAGGRRRAPRDQLADEEARPRLGRTPPRPEEPILRADEADLDPLGLEIGERGEELGVRLRVGDDEVGAAERGAVEREEGACRERAGPEPPPVLDERLVERDERVEDDRSPARRASRRGHVRLAGVADEERVHVAGHRAREPELRERDPCRRPRPRLPVPRPLPHRHVPLDDLDPGPAQRRGDLRVPRIAPLEGAELEDLQDRISSTSRSARSRSGTRSSWWLVIISLIRPSEKNWRPTTTRSTPSVSSGRPPIAWPPSFRIVR